MFRRRRNQQPDDAAGWQEPNAPLDDADYEAEYVEYSDTESAPEDEATADAGPVRADGGPWDAGEPFPERDRVDLGSLQVPVGAGHEIQLVMAEQHGAWVTVRYGESELQVQAFAAARNDALWDDVRAEIAAEIEQAGGRSSESDGPFGIALDAEVPAEPGNPAAELRAVRFIGVDGPRWFLRGLLSGPAAVGGGDADVLEDVFRDIVVSRGEHPVPPRDLLELRLPPEAVQALAEQQAQQEQEQEQEQGEGPDAEPRRDWGDINPFERGPEFTETR
jgi:hypothetical protein